jgi:hypothetical protein
MWLDQRTKWTKNIHRMAEKYPFVIGKPEVNPTIASYSGIVVNFYNATGSLARFKNKKYIILL